MKPTIHDFAARSIDGREVPLSLFKGSVLLVVNVASQCGFTPQYAGLQKTYEKYRDRGLVVLGFPCNQFGRQEPAGEDQIQDFCRSRFGVTFPLFSKVHVNGPDAHPLYRFLTRSRRGVLGTRRIKWNFTKFLINRDGWPVRRFGPLRKPESLESAIERVLSNG